MDFGENDFTSNIHNDEIYNLKDVIIEFCRETNQPKFRLVNILDHLSAFKGSNILKFLMDNPRYLPAQTCLQNYLRINPDLPAIFMNRFLSVINADIQLTRQPINLDNTTLSANVIINNVIPKKEITVGTLRSRVSNLQQELKTNRDVWSVPYREVQPYQIKIDMDDEFIQTLIREQSNLNKTIQEANRCNGSEADSFITSQIRYS